MRALDQLVGGRTVLVISHRLSTLGNVDEIIVLSGGQIVEQGTYKDLKRAGGVFAGLLAEQNRYSLERPEDSILRSAFVPLPRDYEREYERRGSPSQAVQPTPFWSMPAPVPVRPPVPSAPIGGSGGFPRGGADGDRQSSPRPARVVIEVDGKVVSQRQLDKPVLTIGRLANNDVPIPSQLVSRLHAKIRWENGTWLIEDADSLNGIKYQGDRVDRHDFRNGDQIVLGPKVTLRYESV
jgi:hypothetical protein